MPCTYCFGRGHYIVWKSIGRGAHGPVEHWSCPHCKGSRPKLDAITQTAVDWFRESTPPKESFRLTNKRTVTDPAALWKKLRDQLDSGLDGAYEDIIKLHETFATVEEL